MSDMGNLPNTDQADSPHLAVLPRGCHASDDQSFRGGAGYDSCQRDDHELDR